MVEYFERVVPRHIEQEGERHRMNSNVQRAAPPMPRPLSPAPHPDAAAAPHASAEVALIGIYEISKVLTAGRRLEVTLANVVNILSSMLNMHHGMIVIIDRDGEPDIVSSTGWTPQVANHIRARVPQKAIDQIVATATSLVVQDVSADPLFEGHLDLFEAGDKTKISFIGVPIKADNKVLGTLSIDRIWDGRTQFRFDHDMRFLTMVANLVGQTVRLHDMLARDRDRLIAKSHLYEKALEEETGSKPQPVGIIGDSPSLKRLVGMMEVVAPSNSTVLLRGESGTGKELFARGIHELSPRKAKPFVKVNCAALAESVLESELFGHEKGAFTGALQTRQGRFEAAHGGTLFLDEIGEVNASFQAKLLRVLQEGEFERVGGNKTIKIDVRLVFATNKNLEEAVAKGEFRADLYYRINVVTLILPPLRERPGDVSRLAKAFLTRFNRENTRKLLFTQSALDVLQRCYFPGNVRELENCVRRTATLAAADAITSRDFACESGQCLSSILWKGSASKPPSSPVPSLPPGAAPHLTAPNMPTSSLPAPTLPTLTLPTSTLPASNLAGPASSAPYAAASHLAAAARDTVEPPLVECGGAQLPANCPSAENCPAITARPSEREALIQAMEKSGWVQAKAARLLNLTPRQIGYALRKHEIDIKRF